MGGRARRFSIAAALCSVAVMCPAAAAPGALPAGDRLDADGIVYRYYAGHGYRFQPLATFTHLQVLVWAKDVPRARRLASAIVARAVREGGAMYWEYDFHFGGPVPWRSGFVQAVGADVLAQTSVFLDDRSLIRAANASFLGLRRTLVMPLGGGLWVREYGYTQQAILNAQLESLISLEKYRGIVKTERARRVADRFYAAAKRLLPRFHDTGCWSLYQLGGNSASRSYHAYHVHLLQRLSRMHPGEQLWRSTAATWNRCLAGS